MDFLIYFLLAITIFVILTLIFAAATQSSRNVRQRLNDVQVISDEHDDEMAKPFAERVLYPMYAALFNIVGRLTPKRIEEDYRRTILQAGQSEKMTPIRLLVFQVLLALVASTIFGLLISYSGADVNPLLVLLLGVLLFIYPYFRYKSMATLRQKKVRNQLPDFLDMLYISVEAGLAFDAAMKQTAAKMRGPLSQEVTRAMEDISKGRDREEALRTIGSRTHVEEVATFITAVIQSEMLGSNIANMLKVQSRVMREKRQQRAEEEAQKMPLKMLFPMVFFMFPALFVVILGPAMMNIISTLGGL